MKSIAIITGASSGMGREFAEQISRRKDVDEMWIVARREDRLNDLAKAIDIPTKIFALDLIESKSIEKIKEEVQSSGAVVRYLVNGAGFGKFGNYEQVKREEYLGMINLNIKALTDLTNMLVEFMQEQSQIINLCSFSAYLPLENFAVYGASKSYILSYSYALRSELKERKINVTAVSPGWVSTEFFMRSSLGEERNGPKKIKPLTTADKVVKKALRASDKNKPVSIKGAYWKGLHVLAKILPRRLSMQFWSAMQKK